jgi:hypothetical protein
MLRRDGRPFVTRRSPREGTRPSSIHARSSLFIATLRRASAEKGGTPAIPCARLTVNGSKNAAAKPAAEPTKGMAAPVIESIES